jgi:hypothetical protein
VNLSFIQDLHPVTFAENIRIAKSMAVAIDDSVKLVPKGTTSNVELPSISDLNSDSLDSLAELWKQAVSHYQLTASLQAPEQKLFAQVDTELTKFYEDIASKWSGFRRVALGAKGRRFRDKVVRLLHSLQDKISTIDALIGYPAQAVRTQVYYSF